MTMLVERQTGCKPNAPDTADTLVGINSQGINRPGVSLMLSTIANKKTARRRFFTALAALRRANDKLDDEEKHNRQESTDW